MLTFTFQGGNTSLILEESAEQYIEAEDPRSTQVVVVSARTARSLKQNIQLLSNFLNDNPQTKLADMAYTTTARRMHHVFRQAYAVTSTEGLKRLFTNDLTSQKERKRIDDSVRIAYVFSGQGSQYSGMSAQLFETCTAFREDILDYDNICRQHGFPSFLNWITDPDLDLLSISPTQVQLGIVSVELALANLWYSWGLEAHVVVGHSLGEYPALCVAGVLSTSDMLFLVGKRAQLMQQKCTTGTHTMLAAQLPVGDLREMILDGQGHPSCEIACINGPNASVISGEIEDITKLSVKFQASSVKTTSLAVPFAFHSTQISPIIDSFEEAARGICFAKPNIPVASTLLGRLVVDEGVFTASYLARQARNPVDFMGALRDCKSQHLVDDRSLWLECGPGTSCLGMVRSTFGTPVDRGLPSLKRNEEPWTTIAKSVSSAYDNGVDIRWTDYEREYLSNLKLLDLPTYAFDLENYWLQYEGDWSIKKGNYPSTEPSVSQYLTPCLQKVANQTFGNDSASVTFVSSLAEVNFKNMVGGHRVNYHGLCPSSVYADMAFTAASYIHSRLDPHTPVPAMDVSEMEIFQPLIAKPDSSNQSVLVTAERVPGSGFVELRFSSQDGSSESKDHAHCKVKYGDGNEWMRTWAESANAVEERINVLQHSVIDGKADKVLKRMVYKLFQAVVDYDEPYHTLEEVAMDCDNHEATARVKFQTVADGKFVYCPYWIDSIAQLGGFVLNGSPTTPEEQVYLSHGWGSMRIVRTLSEKKSYRSYVHMQPTGARGVLMGDVYMFDEEGSIVSVCKDLKFQQMKRVILHSLLAAGAGVPTNARETAVHRPQKAVAKASAAPDSRPQGTPYSTILAAIVSEIGIDGGELVDDTTWAELGVDSMLTISILSKLRPLTTLDMPSSLLDDFPTIVQLRGFFEKDTGTPNPHITNDMADTDTQDSSITSPSSSPSGVPALTPSSEILDDMDTILSIIAMEIGIKESEIEPATRFDDLGIDSLLSISILASIMEQTGRSLSSSFFIDHPTAAAMRTALEVPSALPRALIAGSPKPLLQKPVESVIQSPAVNPAARPTPDFKSTSVLLRGTPYPSTCALIFLPDGSGSAQSYASFPEAASSIPIYGLDSPFYTCPLDYTLSFSAVSSLYVNSIRKIQPHGPYLLGGWSLGGIHAFEAARQLLEQGEEVRGLFLIDSPCPGTLPPLPAPTFDILDQAGIFEGLKRMGRGIPLSMKQHFLKSVEALENWTHAPMVGTRVPDKVVAIWGKGQMWEGVSEGDVRKGETVSRSQDIGRAAKDWLLGKRSDYGPCGWDELTGREVECHVVDGNHFSIMKAPKVCSDVLSVTVF